MTSAAIAVLAWIRLRDLNYLPFFIAQKRDFYDPPYARRSIDYYLKNKVYAANGEVAMTGLKINIEVQAQDGVLKQPLPPPERYVDLSYLRQAQKELGAVNQ